MTKYQCHVEDMMPHPSRGDRYVSVVFADEAEQLQRERDEALSDVNLWKAAAKDLADKSDAQDREIERLRAALVECQSEIDYSIDAQYPADAHPHFAKQNAAYKRLNPARAALTATDGTDGT